jgi:hypothetical protein
MYLFIKEFVIASSSAKARGYVVESSKLLLSLKVVLD